MVNATIGNSTLGNSTLPNITIFESSLRPFGNLPLLTDISVDGRFAVFGVSAGIGALVFVHWIFLLIALARKYNQISERSQRNNFLLVIASQVTLLLGLVSTAASTREYPMEQPLYAQAFTFACFLGLSLLFLPSLFLKPLFQGKIKGGKLPGETILVIIAAILAVIGVGLEVSVLVKGFDTPKGVLYTIFSYQLVTVLSMLGLGIYSILQTTKYIKKGDENVQQEDYNKPPHSGVRITYLVMGVLGVIGYVISSSFEGGNSLVARGFEVASLFLVLLIQFFFTWSLVKTVAQISIDLPTTKANASADLNF